LYINSLWGHVHCGRFSVCINKTVANVAFVAGVAGVVFKYHTGTSADSVADVVFVYTRLWSVWVCLVYHAVTNLACAVPSCILSEVGMKVL
jgi:hypothetical protein